MKSQLPDEPPFDLESAIAIWRTDLKSRKVRSGSIEELERHLRDALAHRMAEDAQIDLSLVWEEVVADLGSARNLAHEFGKNGRLAIGDYLVLATLGLGLVWTMQVLIRYQLTSTFPLLGIPVFRAHILTIETALFLLMATGISGIYALARGQFSHAPTTPVDRVFGRIVFGSCVLILICGSVGFITGLLFNSKSFMGMSGWGEGWVDPRVIGNIATIIWSGVALFSFVTKPEQSARQFRFAIVGSTILTSTWLLVLIDRGQMTLALAALAAALLAIQFGAFTLRWNEKTPQDLGLA